MRTIAIIPARGGSKRIPRKNLLPLAGLPLIAHSVRHALAARQIAETYVSTDDREIASIAREHGAQVIDRPSELSDDRATSESALLHALDARVQEGLPDPELVVFLQATSPVRSPGDIDNAVESLLHAGADSLFSATEDHALLWRTGGDSPTPLNYDVRSRPRGQELHDQVRENGSIYVFKPSVLRDGGARLGGKVEVYRMDYWSSFEVDSPEDARVLEWILTSQPNA